MAITRAIPDSDKSRILTIAQTFVVATDIPTVNSVTFYRTAQNLADSNGTAIAFSNGTGASTADDIGLVSIELGDTLPPPTIIQIQTTLTD